MKKWMIIGLSVVFIGLLTFGISSYAEPSLTTITNETITYPTTTYTNPYTYTYVDQEDLINQLYEDLYPQIYDELYQTYANDIKAIIQSEIQLQIESMFDSLLSSETLSITYDDLQNRLYDVAELASQSVVGITTYDGSTGLALGSAVIYDYDSITETYYVITNHHVIDEGDNFRVVFSDMTWTEGTLLGYDQDVDIAILSFSNEVANQTLRVSPLGSSASLTKGTTIVASGHPKGYDFYGTFTMGTVSGVNRTVPWDEVVAYIQHDASINSGNSGGPIYNLDGEVVGINVSKFITEDIDGMGFAIPIDQVKSIETSIRRIGGSFTDTYYRYEDGTVEIEDYILGRSSVTGFVTLTLPDGVTTGLMATHFVTEGPLADSGLMLGDLVVQVNDVELTTYQAFHEYVAQVLSSGQTITLWYYEYNPMTLSYGSTLLSTTLILN